MLKKAEFTLSLTFGFCLVCSGKGPNNRVLLGDLVTKGSFASFSQTWKEALVFGLIADVQHANLDDGPNFKKTRVRRYRPALDRGLKLAVNEWLTYDVECAVQLGDIIDGQAKRIGDSALAIARVRFAVSACV